MRMCNAILAVVLVAVVARGADEITAQATLQINSTTTGFQENRTVNDRFSLATNVVQGDTVTISLPQGATTKVSTAVFPMGWSVFRNQTSGSVVRVCTSLNAGTNLADVLWLDWKGFAMMQLATNAHTVLYAVPVQSAGSSVGTNAVLEKRIFSK